MATKLVNGPVNAFRLEGKIGNVNKVFYFFGDIHNPISSETKCNSFISEDFVNYFYKTMMGTDKTIKYDFIHENYVDIDMFESHKYSDTPYREKYISEVSRYIDNDMDIKVDDKEGIKNSGSKTIPNLRLHFLDIRNFYDTVNVASIPSYIMKSIENYDYTVGSYGDIVSMIVDFVSLKEEIKFLLNHLSVHVTGKGRMFKGKFSLEEIGDSDIEREVSKYTRKIPAKEKRMTRYSEKMFKKYTNPDVADKLRGSDIFKGIFVHGRAVLAAANYCLRKLLRMKEIGQFDDLTLHKNSDGSYDYGIDANEMKRLLTAVELKVNKCSEIVTHVYSNLTDLYCLRRLLDKDYVTHAIVYSGIYHTNNYVRTLVRDFGFRLTHAAYSKVTIEETNELLRGNGVYDYVEIFFRPQFKQCVDMGKFPPNFT